MSRRRLGNLGVPRIFWTEDRDVELLRRQHLLIILVAARSARGGEGAFKVRSAAALNTYRRRGSRYRVGARDDVGATGGDKPVHQFVHMHVGEPDYANPVGSYIWIAHGSLLTRHCQVRTFCLSTAE